MVAPARDRIKLFEIMVLIAGLAIGIWLMLPGRQGRSVEWIGLATYPLGGLSIAGLPLLLAERRGRGPRRRAFGAGRLLWFAQGMAALLLWPPTIYLKLFRPETGPDGLANLCFVYVSPLLSLFLMPALAIGGWLGRRRRRRMASWRERFGLGLTLAWAALGLYLLGEFYLADFRR